MASLLFIMGLTLYYLYKSFEYKESFIFDNNWFCNFNSFPNKSQCYEKI